jgi:hypothetical protein
VRTVNPEILRLGELTAIFSLKGHRARVESGFPLPGSGLCPSGWRRGVGSSILLVSSRRCSGGPSQSEASDWDSVNFRLSFYPAPAGRHASEIPSIVFIVDNRSVPRRLLSVGGAQDINCILRVSDIQ